ncbi:MAG: hypothetical protein NTW67_05250 [Candidatus Woesearchaeota archaeon]|nr:hypothetical protein [Candidatus Woesearchaeota archaeon]
MDNFDFDWVYKFNALLAERFGFSDKKRIITLPVRDLFYFVRRADTVGLSSRLCLDAISSLSESLVDITVERGKVVCYGLTGNPADFDRVVVAPERLFYIVDPNPLLSYVALFGKGPSNGCVLFYPHGSSLMSDKHKSRVLDDLLVDPHDARSFLSDKTFEQEWEKYSDFDNVVCDRIASSVLRYLAVEFPELEMEVLVDSEYCDEEGDIVRSEDVVANVALYHSSIVDHDALVSRTRAAFKKFFPFETVVYDVAYNRHLTQLSVLFLTPDSVNAREQ